MEREELLFEQMGIDNFNEALCIAFASELQSSFAIENITLDSSLIKSSLIRRMNLDLPGWKDPGPEHDRESRAVKMTLSMLNVSPLSHQMIEEAHGYLSDSVSFGHYRLDGEEVIVDGTGRVVYHAPDAFLVRGQMNDFLDWWHDDRLAMPSQLGSAIAHYIFVAIHPFADGNGRMARALAEKSMITDENHIFRPYSISAKILQNRGEYYEALGSADPVDFPAFILNMHISALDDAFDKCRRLQFMRYFVSRGEFEDNEKAVLKTIILSGRDFWLPTQFREIENAEKAWNSLRSKGVIDKSGFFNKEWRKPYPVTNMAQDFENYSGGENILNNFSPKF